MSNIKCIYITRYLNFTFSVIKKKNNKSIPFLIYIHTYNIIFQMYIYFVKKKPKKKFQKKNIIFIILLIKYEHFFTSK